MCDLLEAISRLLFIAAIAGGESSLATMALLLSLGEHVDSPFRSEPSNNSNSNRHILVAPSKGISFGSNLIQGVWSGRRMYGLFYIMALILGLYSSNSSRLTKWLYALSNRSLMPYRSDLRVMDEFDVFMDSQLRKIAVKQIMAFAQKGDKFRQIILITPQVSKPFKRPLKA